MNLPGGFELLLLLVLFGVVSGVVARRRGRSPLLWGFLGLWLGPLALLVVAVLPPERGVTAA